MWSILLLNLMTRWSEWRERETPLTVCEAKRRIVELR